MPSSTGSVIDSCSVIPLNEQLLHKQRLLTQGPGNLSEIGEEPGNVLSTTRDGAPSVEPEISRISSNENSSSALNNLQVGYKDSAETVQDHPVQQFRDISNEDHHATVNLPPPTKKYILVLDLDETLIHSHVQYKKTLNTRAQQQEYFNELAIKFIQENGRDPSKEELENLALEMVFNIRPFAEEFLNTMAKEFEIIIFTAGEQDVSASSIFKNGRYR